MDQGSSVLPRSMLVDPGAYAKQIEAYSQWISRSAQILSAGNVDKGVMEQDAQEIVKFEMKFAKVNRFQSKKRMLFFSSFHFIIIIFR